ncbi:zinc finger BED domain-containing protein 6-like isoform X1 [Lithobates pipiens]
MSGRPTRRSRRSHATIRGPAASVSTGKGGYGPSSCQVGSSDEDRGDADDEVTESTWVPDRAEEESEGEAQPQQGRTSSRGSHHRRVESSHPILSDRGAHITWPTSQISAVWAFFSTCAADRSVAICNLCRKQIKRGKNTSHLGTTCLTRHLNSHHSARWQQHLKATHKGHNSSHSSSFISTPAIYHDDLLAASTDKDDDIAKGVTGPCNASASSTPPAVEYSRQIFLPQLLQRKKKYTPCHPHAQRLNSSLTKLLASELLPFRLVDSAPFREFAECAVPQWQVPSRHFFARKAIPALYHHVEGNVLASLGKAISSKVHITADTWSSKLGQGRYISFTAHWVTLLATRKDAGQGSVLELLLPPRLHTASGDDGRSVSSTPSSSSSMLSSAELSYEPPVPPKRSRGYSMSQATRCHAVLQLVCLGDRSHTAAEILSALQGQAQRWLTPRQLEPGMVVCDNGTNLLSALQQGELTHVPCLAHVLNLVVQRFLNRYPGLKDLLRQARRVCSHFKRSYTASARLAEIQHEFHLPVNRLICDMPTRWNSTLAMLQQLHMQQRAINEYLCEYGTRTGSGQLGLFSPHQWLLIKDACTVLSPFEEGTRMVSRDNACISDTIPVVFLLEHTLHGIMDRALEAEQREEEEDFLSSQGPLFADTILAMPQNTQEEEEEDSGSCGGIEAEDDICQSLKDGFQSPETLGVVRSWEEAVPDSVILSDPEDSDSHAPANLRRMGSLILQSLRKDPRICGIKEKDHYWLATLLDHRYKGKVSELILPSQREHRMKYLEDALKRSLCNTFPDSGRIQSNGKGIFEASVGQRRSGGEGGRLSDAFKTFFSPQHPGLSASRSHRQRLHHMVEDYLGTKTDMESFTVDDPLGYWVMRIDHWPELAQYAIELLGCPASSRLSEWAFSAAGGFVINKRGHLSTDSVDRLTFLKMNQSWISNSYQAPDADVTN